MATVTIDVTAGAQSMSMTRTVSGAHLTRFLTALRRAFSLPPETTDVQVLERWAQYVFNEAKSLTKIHESAIAAAAVTDTDWTP